MANDHDKHTCGCDDCNTAYNQRYYGSNDNVKPSLKSYSNVELKNEIGRRANERKALAKKAKTILEERSRRNGIEAEKRRVERNAASAYNTKIYTEINELNEKVEALKKRLK